MRILFDFFINIARWACPLSKRTTTYAYAGYNHGSKGLKADITANQTIKLNGYQVGVGMTHNF